ncbi:MAG: hypothetical protein JWM11_6611 [Planctomycetaceae bacterium]|nr:hypothetical protein [Planctomycetaceae bacterium]
MPVEPDDASTGEVCDTQFTACPSIEGICKIAPFGVSHQRFFFRTQKGSLPTHRR